MLPSNINLYDYQEESINQLRAGFVNGFKHQLLNAPTGAGKTIIASYLMAAAKAKGTKIAFIVDRVSLVDQTSAALDKYGIDHGVIQAGHWRFRPYENIQICSAQTIEKRGFFPDLGMLIVDECHNTRKATAKLIKARPDLPVIGLTATPFSKGLAELYHNVVNVITTNELIEKGYLTALKAYAAKAIDMTGAKVVAGEWAEKEIEERGRMIIGDIVSEWQDKTNKHFGGPVKTIVFSATVEHGKELCEQFNAAGFNFQQISYKDGSDDERRQLIEEFRKPDSMITGLVSCEVFTKGFDVPDILCGIAARPYKKSLSSHIQQMGRVMRSSPGKEFGLWLDHCGNYLRFKEDTDNIYSNGLKTLDDGELDRKDRKEPTKKEKEQLSCVCGFVFPHPMKVCPACGKEKHSVSDVEVVAGVMEEVQGTVIKPFLRDETKVWSQLCTLGLQRRKGDTAAAHKYAKGAYFNFYGKWPRRGFEAGETPTIEVVNLVKHHNIRFARGKQRVAA